MLVDKAWVDPVYPATADRDLVAITTTGRAAELLVHFWPDECPKREAALKACLAVLVEDGLPELSRQAFISAAREAGLLVIQSAACRH